MQLRSACLSIELTSVMEETLRCMPLPLMYVLACTTIMSNRGRSCSGTFIGSERRRSSISFAELLCIVPTHPLWPVSIAMKSVPASAPLTSPSIMRSGLILIAFLRRSSISIPRLPRSPCFVSIWTQFSRPQSWISGVSSIETILSEARMKDEIALRVVVLPEPEPPVMITFNGSMPSPSTITHRKAATSGDIVPLAISSIMLMGTTENFLTVRVGPESVTDPRVALALLPSESRASSKGFSSSSFLPTVSAIFCRILSRSFLTGKPMLVLHGPNVR
ncbi:Uncharacterised protein [uncultured archaeon]|nr:Uncharacterised protein [uncultured archaeon]